MPTTIQQPTRIVRARALSVRPIADTGQPFPDNPNAVFVYGLTDVPVVYQIEQGERVVDKADGVGVIAVHEEDDTLVGADLTLTGQALDLLVLSTILGGTLQFEGTTGKITGWRPPTITQQRDDPRRVELDVYAETDTNGLYVRHRFFYCKGMPQGLAYGLAPSSQGIIVKARPHPATGETHLIEYVSEIPNI